MIALAPHDHEIDGSLHDGCPMCAEIVVRREWAKREAGVDLLAARFAAIAEQDRRVRNDGAVRPLRRPR